jgi:hypothetical protein
MLRLARRKRARAFIGLFTLYIATTIFAGKSDGGRFPVGAIKSHWTG